MTYLTKLVIIKNMKFKKLKFQKIEIIIYQVKTKLNKKIISPYQIRRKYPKIIQRILRRSKLIGR